jgi:hypothetical protein
MQKTSAYAVASHIANDFRALYRERAMLKRRLRKAQKSQ